MSEIKHPDGSISVGILEDMKSKEDPVENPVETVEKPKKKTSKKK